MKTLYTATLLALSSLIGTVVSAQQAVINSHPRLMIDSKTKPVLLAKKAANDPSWTALKAEADNYAQRPVMTWNPNTTGVWNTAYIFYNYCGSSWMDAAFTLGMAHQLTKTNNAGANHTAYSNKLLELADTMISGYKRYPPCSGCPNMLTYNSTYADRNVGPAIAVIFDWCYDELGATRKAALVAMIDNWFNYARIPFNTYQNNSHATGNYYFGHAFSAAYLGYATMYDSNLAATMIAYARQRVLGTKSSLLGPNDLTVNWLSQSYTGGIPSSASTAYLGPKTFTAAPQKLGMQAQGWSYGSENVNRIIDYCYIVKSATGENIADSLNSYLINVLRAFVHALTPNRFQVDNGNDWGSFVGNQMPYAFPLRLSSILANSSVGPQAQYFYKQWIQPVKLAATWANGYPELNWEKLMFDDNTRPSAPFIQPPFYPDITKHVYSSVAIDEALPKYYMRENWSDTATWSTYNISNAFYDDHDHHNAGHFQIVRGNAHDGDDLLLVGTNEISNGGAFGLNGIQGGTCYHMSSSHSNTLYIDDYNDYVEKNNYMIGGQSFFGWDEPTHVEQNDAFSYVRADLTSAYIRKGDPADSVNRCVRYFYRSFFYLREADVFICYDRFKIKNSTHPNGQFKKHIRWHFMENPVISGNNITATMDQSKLFIHTVLPANASIAKVDESNNPDNTYGSSLDYAFNIYAWRAEVQEAGNPLQQRILSVLQPGSLTAKEMTTSALTTDQQNMEGTTCDVNGKKNIILFNLAPDKYLKTINSQVSYAFNGDINVLHTLCGMMPDQKFQVDYTGGKIQISSSATGNWSSSPAGVLQFKLGTSSTINEVDKLSLWKIYPNPARSTITCEWSSQTFPLEIEVLDLSGALVQKYTPASGERNLRMTISKAGYYFVRFKTKEGQSIRKIVII